MELTGGRIARTLGRLTALALSLVLTLPVALVGQTPDTSGWVTVLQQVDVEMGEGDGSADVEIRFELAAQEPGAALPLEVPVTFEMLGFGHAVAEELTVRGGEGVVLWPTVGSHRVATVRLTEADVSDGVARLAASYRVDDVLEAPGAAVHARIPLLTGPPVRAETGGDAFQARISVPEEWAVTEGFPSAMRPSGPGEQMVSLTVAPSIVGFRARKDGSWRPGFPLLVDVATVLFLLTFAGFGWRHLRWVAAGGEAS